MCRPEQSQGGWPEENASGYFADRFGARRIFRLAIAVFTVGSILCGHAQTLPFLVGARVLQGAGGAMMLPVGRLILLRSVPKERLISAMAWVTMPALVGPVIGPPLGGLIVEYTDWRWIFYINVPIGVLGITLASIWVPDRREPAGRFDLPGLLLSGVALVNRNGLYLAVPVANAVRQAPLGGESGFVTRIVRQKGTP